jgi:hypothetical protein
MAFSYKLERYENQQVIDVRMACRKDIRRDVRACARTRVDDDEPIPLRDADKTDSGGGLDNIGSWVRAIKAAGVKLTV